MAATALRVIELAEPHVRIVLRGEAAPLLSREGDTDWACGACGATLAERTWLWEVRNLVFRCPACGAHNEVAK